MSQWKKLLRRMVADQRPVSYRYDEAAGVLERLKFTQAPPEGSHRRFWKEVPDPTSPNGKRTVTIGLVDKGSGPVHHVYIRQMVRSLQEHHLLPDDL